MAPNEGEGGTKAVRLAGTAGRPASAPIGGSQHRDAVKPGKSASAGWMDVIIRTLSEFQRDNIFSVAAGVTFYTLLAIFPAIAALISLYGIIADPGTVSVHISELAGLLPVGAMDVIGDDLKRLTAQKPSALGFGFFIGLATALWSASGAMKAIFDALNIVYEEKEKRGFLKRAAVALTLTAGGVLFGILALGTVVVVPLILKFVGLDGISNTLALVLRWPALFIVTCLIMSVLYRFAPSRATARWRWVTWGSFVAAVLWVAVSLAFSWYVEHFGNYDKTYGSLGAVVGFMTWIWLSIAVFLLGGELDAEIEHKAARNSVAGPDRSFGERGAKMAD